MTHSRLPRRSLSQGITNHVAAQLIGGGIAGMATWASAYPLDVVMSRMQVSILLILTLTLSHSHTISLADFLTLSFSLSLSHSFSLILTLSTHTQAQGAQTRHSDRPRGMVWHAREIMREGGARAFFKGIEPCLLRAFPVNAVIFLVYEQTLRFL